MKSNVRFYAAVVGVEASTCPSVAGDAGAWGSCPSPIFLPKSNEHHFNSYRFVALPLSKFPSPEQNAARYTWLQVTNTLAMSARPASLIISECSEIQKVGKEEEAYLKTHGRTQYEMMCNWWASRSIACW